MPPESELAAGEDPIVITDSQKRVAANRIQGNWSYHLMCIAPVDLFDEKEPVFTGIMESLEPLPLEN
jgi:hypothetical protein